MEENKIQASTAEALSDVFYLLKTIKDLKITGACTQISELPEKMLSIFSLKELSEITRTENYIEAGSAVTLGRLLSQGKSKLPEVLNKALLSIATPQLRNLATLGGNICTNPIKGTLYAPLLALDAKLVFQKENETKTIPITKFSGTAVPYILTKIRIPTAEWDICEFKRIGDIHRLSENSTSYSFLANAENDALTTVRIAFSGLISTRITALENRLAGTRLPLESSTISAVMTDASLEFDRIFSSRTIPAMLKEEFLRLITYSLKKLS